MTIPGDSSRFETTDLDIYVLGVCGYMATPADPIIPLPFKLCVPGLSHSLVLSRHPQMLENVKPLLLLANKKV